MPELKIRRCAIYTRKSTEEGLEQAFNSLDAQRESCAAFILSQAHEGWQNLPELYDDGGYSGGSMVRPGLTQLLADIEAGQIDVVVVYKVDRLTRSLADFAKIVEILDEAGASFVSVTQAFNTTSSMGRLTLNVLLSFAQFEREVTGERIRDKIAASKKKGMWMGGAVPHGFRVADRKLLIAEEEADEIRTIFSWYVELRSVPQLVVELRSKAYRTRVRTMKSGRTIGGVPFGKGALAAILKNPIYIGKIVHHDQIYDGEHEPIIDDERFEAVQQITASNAHDAMLGKRTANPSLLTGMLVDPDGNPMSPVQARKKDRRYRYYATRQDAVAPKAKAWRTSAGPIEKLIVAELAALIAHPDLTELEGTDAETALAIGERSATLLQGSGIVEQRRLLLELGLTIILSDTTVHISFECPSAKRTCSHDIPAKLLRKGRSIRILAKTDGSQNDAVANAGLLELLAKAFAARQQLVAHDPSPLVDAFSKRHQVRLARLSYLAPSIVEAILSGHQPPEMTARSLLRIGTLPSCWRAQKVLLGFG